MSTTNPGLGHKSYVQIAKEVTYNVDVAAVFKSELISWNIAPVIGVIPDPSLYDDPVIRELFQGGILYRGTFVIRANYLGPFMLECLRGVMGGYSSAVVDTTARAHTFINASALNSYGLQTVLGNVPATQCADLRGALLTDMKFKIGSGLGADAMGTLEFSVLGATYQSGQTPSSGGGLVFPTARPVLFHQATVVDDGTADVVGLVRVRSLEVSIKNALADDRWFQGSLNIDQPLRNDFIDVLWRIQQEYLTKTAFDAAQAFTNTSPQFLYQNPILIGAATAKGEFELRSGTAKITEFGVPVEGYGIMLQTVTHRASKDATDATGLLVRVQSTDAALP